MTTAADVPAPEGRDLLIEAVSDVQKQWWTVHPVEGTVAGPVPSFHASTAQARFSPIRGASGDPVPVLYAAEEQMGAVGEIILRHTLTAGTLLSGDYETRALGGLRITRPLTLLVLHSGGLIKAGVTAEQVTATTPYPSVYARIARWGQAAYDLGADGLVWMSRMWNSSQALLLFEDRACDALAFDPGPARVFADAADVDWLMSQCDRIGITLA